jgi:hypothetical protein
LNVTDSGLLPLTFRERYANQHHEIDDRRHEDEAEDDAPVAGGCLSCQGNGANTSENQSTRPSRMKNVQPFGLVFTEHRRDDRVDVRLDGAVPKAKNNASPIKQGVSLPLPCHQCLSGKPMNRAVRRESHERIAKVTDK